jgi:hypothetical protein
MLPMDDLVSEGFIPVAMTVSLSEKCASRFTTSKNETDGEDGRGRGIKASQKFGFSWWWMFSHRNLRHRAVIHSIK